MEFDLCNNMKCYSAHFSLYTNYELILLLLVCYFYAIFNVIMQVTIFISSF